jgi:hypothetical protein
MRLFCILKYTIYDQLYRVSRSAYVEPKIALSPQSTSGAAFASPSNLGVGNRSLASDHGVPKRGSVGDQPSADAPSAHPDGSIIIFPDGSTVTRQDGGICTPLSSCAVGSGHYCGIVGDGCFGSLNCGDCPSGQTCSNGVCSTGSDYDGGQLTSCAVPGGTYCGDIGDGVGGNLRFDHLHRCLPGGYHV